MTNLTQDANCYEINHQLAYYECTDSGHPSVSMVLSMMTMVSDAHSISLGLDRATVDATGGAWVVVGYDGNFASEQPTFGDQVIIGTRALAYNRFFALREFWLCDQRHQHEYVRLRALFVMMNLAKRRLMRIPDQLIVPFDSPLEKRSPRLTTPAKLGADFASQTYRVRYFDIDINHHVNNARYLDWVLDPLGADFLRRYQPQSLAIKYGEEVKEGAVVESRYRIVHHEGVVKTVHEIWSAGQCCTTAELTWQPSVKL